MISKSRRGRKKTVKKKEREEVDEYHMFWKKTERGRPYIFILLV
jgi:hypothetical protein